MNLIICITPLQSLIAQQIILSEPHQAFTCLYMPYGDTPKHRYYFDKLAKLCQQSAYLPLKNSSWRERVTTLYRIQQQLKKWQLLHNSVHTVFIASIDVIFIHYILAKITFDQLMTFDDGTANVFANSMYFVPLKKSLAQRLFKAIIGIKYGTVPTVTALSKKHYTIFPNEKNIIENTQPVSLFSSLATDQLPDASSKVVRLLLGQKLNDLMAEQDYRQVVAQTVKNFDIDYFYPHPRENLDFSDVVKVIDTHQIIEDYLLEAIKASPDTRYEIYTFFSTAVFSLKAFPRTQVFLVYNAALSQQFETAYAFLASRGFTLLALDNITT